MWITLILLLPALYVPTISLLEPMTKCCYQYSQHYDRIGRDADNRIISIRKTLTHENLNTGSPLTEEVKQSMRRSCGVSGNDVIGTTIDEKLGGSGSEISNAIPMNVGTYEIWNRKVIEPIYNFLLENADKSVLFEVKLFYDDINTLRPFFLGVRHRFCLARNASCDTLWSPMVYDQYLVKGFIPNPVKPEAVEPYLYSTDKMMSGAGSQMFEWSVISFDQFNETMKKRYKQLAKSYDRNVAFVTRLEYTQKMIRRGDLNPGMHRVTRKPKGLPIEWARIRGRENDVQIRLISTKLGGSYYDNFVPVIPAVLDELEKGVVNTVFDFFRNASNENREVALRVDALYRNNLTLRPDGFFISTYINGNNGDRTQRPFSGCPKMPKCCFIKN